MPNKSAKPFIVACKDYPRANQALEHLRELLLKKGLECGFCSMARELFAKDVSKALILFLAVWDYVLCYEKFKQFLEKFNFLKNSKKGYLFELECFNLPIIPSILLENFENSNIKFIFFKKPIIKPLVEQSGRGVGFLDEACVTKDEFSQGAIIQPFMDSIYKPSTSTFMNRNDIKSFFFEV